LINAPSARAAPPPWGSDTKPSPCPTSGRPCGRNDIGHPDTRRADRAPRATPRPNKKWSRGLVRVHYCNSERQAAFLPFFMGIGSAFFTGTGSASSVSRATIFCARGRVMLFCVFGRKPIDRGQSIRFRCCSDFRSRHDRLPRQPHDNLTDRIGRRFRSADGLRPDHARVKAGQFSFRPFLGTV
jgi:hypothetical protein